MTERTNGTTRKDADEVGLCEMPGVRLDLGVRLDGREPAPVAMAAPIDSPVRWHDEADDLPPTVEIDEADIEFVTGHLAAALASLYRGSDEAIGSVGQALGYLQALGRDLSRSEGAR